MTSLPLYSLVLGMFLAAQVDPLQGPKGAKGPQPWGPGPPLAQPRNPMGPGQPLWWLTTQFPIWIGAIFVVRRQQRARAERLKMLADEEENQTSYTEEDVMQDFEFKIVRNELYLFDQPQFLAEALREEAQAGWQLVEKFDGNRLRLKRPASQRANDSALPPDYDPYRTAALPEATKTTKAAKRIKDMKNAGSGLAASGTLCVVLGLAATVAWDFWIFVFLFSAFCAAAVAVICVIALIVRYYSE
jgi:hypothetical protein